MGFQRRGLYKLNTYENSVTLTADSTSVEIGISDYNAQRDHLQVHKNTTFVNAGEDYSIVGNTIVAPVGETWAAGTEFNFTVFKNVLTNVDLIRPDGSLIQDGTITNAKLAPDAQVSSKVSLVTSSEVEGKL